VDSENSYIDKQIGNYRVVDELGGGGFGNVYRAQHIFLAKRIVAIKLLNASRLNSQEERESFLYELLTGHPPFTAPDFFALGFKHLMEAPIAPTQLNSNIPEQVEQAILKALAKQRHERFVDVSAFITALRPPPVHISSPQKTKEQWLDDGLAHHEAKRYGEALAAYEQAIQLDPAFAYAYNSKGLALYHLGRYREALNTLERAILLAPNDMSLYYGKGLVSERMQHYQDALQAFEQATRLDPGYAPAWRKKGDVLRILNRRQEALAAYERAMHLDPDDTAAYKSRQELLGK